MRLMVRLLLVVGLTVLLGCGGGSTGLPPVIQQALELVMGMELMETTGGSYDASLPAGFFGPGSDPFAGPIGLQGETFGHLGPFELGTTDTIVERLDDIVLPQPASSQEIPIEMVALSLTSTAPIIVTYNGGQSPEAWDLFIGLDPANKSVGQVELDRDSVDGGDTTGSVFVRAVLSFERVGVPGSVQLLDDFDTAIGGAFSTARTPGEQELADQNHPLDPGFFKVTDVAGAGLNVNLRPAVADLNAQGTLPPGPAGVSPTAIIDPTATLGRQCTVLDGAVIGPRAIIGPGAFISNTAQVGADSVIGDNATVLGTGVVGQGCVIGTMTLVAGQVDDGATVGDNSIVGPGCVVGADAHIGGLATLQSDSTIGARVIAGEFLLVGQSGVVPDDAILAPGAVIPDFAVLLESLITCIDETDAAGVQPESNCGDVTTQAFALEFVPGLRSPTGGIEPPGDTKTPVNPGALPPELAGLAGHVGTSIAPPKNGGTGKPYKATTYDCDDFAEDLRVKLAGLGYTTTFTVIFDVNKNRAFYEVWKPKLLNGHCLTDVHDNAGNPIWIEAQFVGTAGVGRNLDDSGNGTVTFANGPGTTATDGCKRIEVYTSAQDAKDKGRALD